MVATVNLLYLPCVIDRGKACKRVIVMNDENMGKSVDLDPMRLCYVCRMPISVLATRCRFCGVEVGRPRKEQEKFTVQDLGGEKVGNYTVSGNVTDALESFMMEERAQIMAVERERIEARNRTLTGRLQRALKGDSDARNSASDAETSVGSSSIDNISLSPVSQRSTSQRPNMSEDSIGSKILVVVAVIVGLVVLYFASGYAWSWIRGYGAQDVPADNFVYPNRAHEILARGGSIVEAHEDALIALRYNDTRENRDIAREIRDMAIKDVKARAYAVPFDMNKLATASRDITQIARRDNDAEIMHIMEVINREVGYFAFLLTQLDLENGTATFRLNNPALLEKEQQVEAGDLLQGRFKVLSVSSRGVLLEDTNPETPGRKLLAKRMVAVEPY